ncbi:hypothetical protein F2Q68_00011076 [Brassica cretica]|uniref:Uncharacterized protein n=1 Tax=Brassica cretica TaxID=69181 RepID=A0A8S9KX90_BRACR|nr:hypothetical protein F2Q68_00011076 [Brassica cretica]
MLVFKFLSMLIDLLSRRQEERISHDIYSCTEVSPEEREKKIKELRELNSSGTTGPHADAKLALTGPMGNNGSNRGNVLNNKRPRSPNGDGYQRSPNRGWGGGFPGQSRDGKRHKESENDWNSKTTSSRDGPLKTSERWRETKEIRYPRHQEKTTVWNRLDDRPTGQDKRKTTVHNPRPRQNSMDRQRGCDLHQSREHHNSHQSQASQQAWRPRAQINGKSNSPSRTVTNSRLQRASTPEKSESQQTISRGLHECSGMTGQGNEVLVIHRNETAKKKLRRLKGKAIMQEEPAAQTPSSALQRTPHAVLTRDRGTVVIREVRTRSPPPALRSVTSPPRLRDEPMEPCLELANLMESSHIDDIVLTREEEAEVDKLVEEFGDVVMDETMLQNDDLLVDESGYDAEIIEAISQLSPENVENKSNGTTAMDEATMQPIITDQVQKKETGLPRIKKAGFKQDMTSGAEDRKKSQSSDLKGAQAYKKLYALRGRPSPRKRGSGLVGSQKPPSKKI